MFRHDMLETKNNTVKIEDVPFEAMGSIIRYIYVGDIFYMTDLTRLDVIKAADKYQILDLKEMCENDILEILSVENCLQFFSVADQSNASTLKTEIIDLIVENAQNLLESPEFQSLTRSHPQLICEVVRKIATR